MFRGGSYIDKEDFADQKPKYGYDKMSTNDIDGSKPKKLFMDRKQKQLGSAGAQIMESSSMMVAGVKQNA
jgi:hypothetical protein